MDLHVCLCMLACVYIEKGKAIKVSVRVFNVVKKHPRIFQLVKKKRPSFLIYSIYLCLTFFIFIFTLVRLTFTNLTLMLILILINSDPMMFKLPFCDHFALLYKLQRKTSLTIVLPSD